jgi:DNA-binding GntR family transcriptional regulator
LVAQLTEEIRSGSIEPGSRLRQGEVAARFGVSTTPVREAFAMLERQGLLVASAHRGMTVFKPSIDDLNATYEIRIPLEALATEKAVENMGESDIELLDELIQKMAKAEDLDRYGELNSQFHASIYAVAKRPRLSKLIAELREESAGYLRLYATLLPGPEQTHPDHVAIFEACKAGRAKRAGKAMTAHLEHTVEYVSRDLATHELAPTTQA